METLKDLLMNENTVMKSKEELRKNSMYKLSDFEKERFKDTGKFIIDRIRKAKKCGIGERYSAKTFRNYELRGNEKAVSECKLYCKNFVKNLHDGKGLFLTGTVGTGKTHLLAAIIDYIARIYKRKYNLYIEYFTSTGLLSELKSSYEDKTSDDLIFNIKHCTLLIIDDFGAEKTTDWVLETYFEIIDYRYANLYPTIIATNLTDKEIKEKLSERIMSGISYRDWETDRKSTRLNSSHSAKSRMPSSA